jgi:hypothetical protein
MPSRETLLHIHFTIELMPTLVLNLIYAIDYQLGISHKRPIYSIPYSVLQMESKKYKRSI